MTTGNDGTASETAAATLLDRDLVVVSNRQPYSHDRVDGEIEVSEPAGGLTAALDPVLREVEGTWVAWGSGDADREVADEQGSVRVPPDDPAYDLQRVWLSDERVDGYYYGYANQVLWPVCHLELGRANFAQAFWDHYRAANRAFADATVEAAEPDSLVWFQDYHLALAPGLVADQLPDAFLAQFWHIPWPSWDAFQTCPQYRPLLEGLLANDLIGFHVDRYRRNFMDCVEGALDARIDRATASVAYDGNRTYVRSFPISVDFDRVEARAADPEAVSTWDRFQAERGLEGVKIATCVDRLDYTKGIPQRLAALERLWERNPEWRGELTFVQKATPSRSYIPEYRRLRERVEHEVERINDRFGTDDWQPICYIDSMLTRAELGALYRGADVALVSPVRDGMNLVAKEYVASQVEDPGVLVLSELAGASDELGPEALRVHPYDIEGFADVIDTALTMDEAEREHRMARLRRHVRNHDVHDWMNQLFRSVQTIDRGGEHAPIATEESAS